MDCLLQYIVVLIRIFFKNEYLNDLLFVVINKKNNRKKVILIFILNSCVLKKSPKNSTLKGEKWNLRWTYKRQIWKQSIPVENRQNCDRKRVTKEYNSWYSWRYYSWILTSGRMSKYQKSEAPFFGAECLVTLLHT